MLMSSVRPLCDNNAMSDEKHIETIDAIGERLRNVAAQYLARAADVTLGAERWEAEPQSDNSDFYLTTIECYRDGDRIGQEYGMVMAVRRPIQEWPHHEYSYFLLRPDGTAYGVGLVADGSGQGPLYRVGLTSLPLRDGSQYPIDESLDSEHAGLMFMDRIEPYAEGGYKSAGTAECGEDPEGYISITAQNLGDKTAAEDREQALAILNDEFSAYVLNPRMPWLQH
jgi:hypothetical protein